MIVLAATTAATAMQVGEGASLGSKGEEIILITLSEEVVMLKKGDVSCPAFEFIYTYFSFTLSRFRFLMNSSFIFCDVIFAFVLVLPCM